AGAGQACDVRSDMMQLHMHLHQGLLHMLDMWRGIPHQHIALTHIASEDADVIVRPKRGTQQPDTMQLLNPLTIDHVSLASRPKSRVAVTRGNSRSASSPPHSVIPEITKPLGGQFRVAHRVLNMAMPEILLDGAGIDAFVREVKATGMAQHMGMDRKG